MLENSEIEAGVVTEDSKKFDGYGLNMKHLKETTEREIHSAIDLVGGKDEDMSKSFRSKSDEEVATLMREGYGMLGMPGTSKGIMQDVQGTRKKVMGTGQGMQHGRTRGRVRQHLSDGDIEALISDEIFQPQVVWSLGDVQVACGTLGLSTATIKLVGGEGVEHVACSVGTGPVDAAYKAVDLIVKVPVTLLEYSMNSVTEGIDAIASTRVVIRGENGHMSTNAITGETVHRVFSGNGAGMDIVVSSVRAYISALNKMLGFKNSESSKNLKSVKVPA
ncbi:hypothetical protein GIB67_012534 [Kingdonia uniflora]|uniref:2-isopropylmalate synthase n=1 Tax=Kingdonia uniflora TaxID=39325 RepID=A0A7J7N5H3_9MAGN|nr:hypothetical protein GIB67_012534 [Kingdonia uniflora]